MSDHETIMKAKFVRFPEGEVVNVDTESKTGQVVFVEGSVDGCFYNLLRSSAILYQTMAYEKEQLEALIDAAKAIGADAIVPKLEEMLAPVEFALTIAVHGVEAYIQEPKQ